MSRLLNERLTAPARLFSLFVALIAGLLISSAPAGAAIPYTKLFAGPVAGTPGIAASGCSPDGTAIAAQAGSSTDFCIAYSVNSPGPRGDDLKSETVDTPIAFAAQIAGIPTCAENQFNLTVNAAPACPAGTQIGDGSADAILGTGETDTDGGDLEISGLTGRVFNLTTTGGEVARFGLVLDIPGGSKIKVIIRATLRPAPSYGLRTVIDDLPRSSSLLGTTYPISTSAVSLRLWGAKTAHPALAHDFAVLGTDCTADQTARISGSTYEDPSVTTEATSAAYKLTGCEAVPFQPTTAITTTERAPDRTTESSVAVRFAQPATGPASSTVKETVVTLPAGLSLSAQIASGPEGLHVCSADQFAQTSAAAAACPAGSGVGTVKITSPLIDQPLTGTAFLGAQSAVGELPDLYIEAALGDAAAAPRIKLTGRLRVDDQNRVVTTLSDLPQLGFSEFLLTFRGGNDSVLTTPTTCGTTTGTLVATPYSAPGAPVTSTSDYTVDQACDTAGGFTPQVAFASSNPVAGAHGTFTTGLSRRDRDQRLTHADVDLPAGVVATLTGVPECSQAAAAAGSCPADTRVGTVSTLAGVGATPYRVEGAVYLVTRQEGSVVGIALSVPVKLGDIDLGVLNLPANITIRGNDQGLRFSTDIPQYFKGLPLNLRNVSVALDRANFALNPTNCATLVTSSQITGSGGTVAGATGNFQVSGCEKLPFEPQIDAAVTGATQRLGRPDLDVKITVPAGGGNLHQTYVTLPNGLGVDLDQIPRACPQAEFLAGGCAPTAAIGTVGGALAITDEPLTGSLYLLKPSPGKTLPALGLAFAGRFAARVVGSNQINTKTGQLVTAFDTIPDLPITTLELNIKGGQGGLLVSNGALCTSATVDFGARFVAQSGPVAGRTVRTNCGVPLGLSLRRITPKLNKMSSGRPTLVLSGTTEGVKKIARVDVTFPKGFTVVSSRAKSSKGVALKNLTAKGSTRTLRVSSRTLRAYMPKEGTTRFKLLVRTGTLSISSSKLRKTKADQAVKVVVVYTNGSKATLPLSVDAG